jgi:hypothetical protein
VTFEQAKLLKEKNFNIDVKSYYTTSEEFTPKDYYYYGNEINYNSPINDINNINGTISRPEQWQVVEWLRVNHGIWVCVDREEGSTYWKFNIRLLQLKGHKYGGFGGEFNSPQEAYSAAFEYIKDNSHQYE